MNEEAVNQTTQENKENQEPVASKPASRKASETPQTNGAGRKTSTAATPIVLPPIKSSAGIPESSRQVLSF